MISFNKRFKIPSLDQDELRRRFVNRIQQVIWDSDAIYGTFINHSVLEEFGFGNALLNRLEYYYGQKQPDIHSYHGHDFHKNLFDLEIFYKVLDKPGKEKEKNLLSRTINMVIRDSGDIGITWRDGKFYPSGAKVLDEGLVNDVLDWLDEDKYARVKAPFQKALSHYLEAVNKPERLADVVTDMYEALEAFARICTGKESKTLDANKQEFISSLKLNKIYEEMLDKYIDYAHRYRHGENDSKPRPPLKKHEVEAFIYQTGLFIRLGLNPEIR